MDQPAKRTRKSSTSTKPTPKTEGRAAIKGRAATKRPAYAPTPTSRPLRAFSFDPTLSRQLGNEMSVEVRYQELLPGPIVTQQVSDRIAVVDYDGARKKYYRPVDLDDPGVLIGQGLGPSEADPRFHQQMVYAVASETIEAFEAALGRRIHWRREARHREDDHGWRPGDIRTLHLFPHAMQAANAFYSPDAHGILFGYFAADTQNPGICVPGQPIFTCLSHDIVVHETTHAIVDGLRGFFIEPTNVDVAAFHEGFADIVALFRHFSHQEVLVDTIRRTGGLLYAQEVGSDVLASDKPVVGAERQRRNPLIALAQEFGQGSGMQRELRNALPEPPDPRKLRTVTEPHARGSIFVAAIFDAFSTVYARRAKRLLDACGIATLGASAPLSHGLIEMLARAATKTADQCLKICIRALDYCPPVDITFGDFLRAAITADVDIAQSDPEGFREALVDGFRVRGIVPDGAHSYSEDALTWDTGPERGLGPIEGLDYGNPNGLTSEEKKNISKRLRAYVNDDRDVREKLGLDPDRKVMIPSFHPLFRVQRDGSLRTDMVVEFVQEAPLEEAGDTWRGVPLRGGATVIFSIPAPEHVATSRHGATSQAEVRYVIDKRIHGAEGAERARRQIAHMTRAGGAEGATAQRFQLDFSHIHGVV